MALKQNTNFPYGIIIPTARQALTDCKDWLRVMQKLSKKCSVAEWRRNWVATINALRIVGHVLQNYEAKRDPCIQKVVDEEWAQIKTNRDRNSIFWKFIKKERDEALKTYRFGASPHHEVGFVSTVHPDGRVTMKKMFERRSLKMDAGGPFGGHKQQDVIKEAIAWWNNLLTRIEQEVIKRRANQNPSA